MFSVSEKIGALPGSLDEKIQPFILSIKDNLEEMIHDKGEVQKILANRIEALTMSTLRGRSLHNAFIIVEETQNISLKDDGILLILTRMGKDSKVVFTGDMAQADIETQHMALPEAISALSELDQVAHIELDGIRYNHRNPLVGHIIRAFEDSRSMMI